MDPTFDPREVNALVCRAAIALRESVEAERAVSAAGERATEKHRAFRAAREELDAYLGGAIHRAEKRLVPGIPATPLVISSDRIAGGRIEVGSVLGRLLSEDEIRAAHAAEHEDTGGGACT